MAHAEVGIIRGNTRDFDLIMAGMILEYTTHNGKIAQCEFFIDQVGGMPALLFVQAHNTHPIRNEIILLVEKVLETHFHNVRDKQIDLRVFEHYPSKNIRKQVCTEVILNIKRRSIVRRLFCCPKKKWRAYNPRRREIHQSSAVYFSLMWILSAHTSGGYYG